MKRSFFLILALFTALLASACQGSRVRPSAPDGVTALQAAPSAPTPEHTLTPGSTASPFRPLQTATATPAVCLEQTGQIRSETLAVPELAQTLLVYLYLPPCFPDASQPAYPLLVLLHGQTYDQDHWLDLGLEETADRLISTGAIPPILILMPFEEFNLQDPSHSQFDKLVLEVMLPWAEAELPVCSQAACRGIGGISRGGGWALHMAIERPDLFDTIGMHSSPPFTSDAYRLVRDLVHLPEEQRPNLLIDVGDTDMYRGYIVHLHDELLVQDIEHTFTGAPGGHEDTYWQTHLEAYLHWYGSMLESPR